MQAIRVRLQHCLLLSLMAQRLKLMCSLKGSLKLSKPQGPALSVSVSPKKNETNSGQAENLHFRL